MDIILFILGLILGLLINPIKVIVKEVIEEQKSIPKGKTTFIEPIGDKERFDKAEVIDDLLIK